MSRATWVPPVPDPGLQGIHDSAREFGGFRIVVPMQLLESVVHSLHVAFGDQFVSRNMAPLTAAGKSPKSLLIDAQVAIENYGNVLLGCEHGTVRVGPAGETQVVIFGSFRESEPAVLQLRDLLRTIPLGDGWAEFDDEHWESWVYQLRPLPARPLTLEPLYARSLILGCEIGPLIDVNADLETETGAGGNIVVDGERSESRRALAAVSRFLINCMPQGFTGHYTSGELPPNGPWLEGPPLYIEPGMLAREFDTALTQRVLPRRVSEHEVSIGLLPSRLGIGARGEELLAICDTVARAVEVQLRRMLAATWPEPVDPMSGFVTTTMRRDGHDIVFGVAGELSQGQIDLFYALARQGMFSEATRAEYSSGVGVPGIKPGSPEFDAIVEDGARVGREFLISLGFDPDAV